MSYESQPTYQFYGNQQYLAHVLKGDTAADDRYLFGQRVPSYGVFNFGSINVDQEKTLILAEHNIRSHIQLKSAYAFNNE